MRADSAMYRDGGVVVALRSFGCVLRGVALPFVSHGILVRIVEERNRRVFVEPRIGVHRADIIELERHGCDLQRILITQLVSLEENPCVRIHGRKMRSRVVLCGSDRRSSRDLSWRSSGRRFRRRAHQAEGVRDPRVRRVRGTMLAAPVHCVVPARLRLSAARVPRSQRGLSSAVPGTTSRRAPGSD